MLSHDPSPWKGEHYFAVTQAVPGKEMLKLSGDYLTRVFEGPYKNMRAWEKELKAYVKDQGKQYLKSYFFYTTRPKCAKTYGENYVVGVAHVQQVRASRNKLVTNGVKSVRKSMPHPD